MRSILENEVNPLALKRPTIKNPELVEAMATFKKDKTSENEEAMLELIHNASFIAPITLEKSLDDVAPDEEGQRHMKAQLVMASDGQGRKMFPAFTDWVEFLKWKNEPDADTMVITFDQYCDILLKQNTGAVGIVINPAESGIVIQKGHMAKYKGVEVPDDPNANLAIRPLLKTDQISNPELVRAAWELRSNPTQDNTKKVIRYLQSGRFVGAAIVRDLPKNVQPGEKTQLKAEFIMITQPAKEGQDEQKLLPLFTSFSELQKWSGAPEHCCGMPLTLANYAELLSNPQNNAAGIVVDPFSLGLTFRKDQVLQMVPRLELQELKVFPMDMAHDLSNVMADIPEIQCAYLTSVLTNGKEGYLIIIDVENQQDIKSINETISAAAKKYGAFVIAPAQSPIGKKAIETQNLAPFYEA